MKKILIFMSSMLFILSGCNTQQVINDTRKTISTTIQRNGSNEQNTQNSTEDIEDTACKEKRYDQRTVCRIQVHLNSLGYKAGPEDGLMGHKTASAIKQFQRKYNIQPADGKASFPLLARLRKENINYQSPLKTAAFSAAACGVAAKLMKKDVGTWAMICGAAGGILQKISNDGREEYAMRYYEIKDENEQTENEINQLAKQTRSNEGQVKSHKAEIEQLIENEKNDKQFITKASEIRRELDEQARENKRAKRKAELKIAILDDQIKDVEKILAEMPNEQEFKTTLASLKKQKTTLVDAVNKSNGVEKELVAQKGILDKAIIERS